MVSVRKNQIDELGEADTRHLPVGSLRPEAIPMDGGRASRADMPDQPELVH